MHWLQPDLHCGVWRFRQPTLGSRKQQVTCVSTQYFIFKREERSSIQFEDGSKHLGKYNQKGVVLRSAKIWKCPLQRKKVKNQMWVNEPSLQDSIAQTEDLTHGQEQDRLRQPNALFTLIWSTVYEQRILSTDDSLKNSSHLLQNIPMFGAAKKVKTVWNKHLQLLMRK